MNPFSIYEDFLMTYIDNFREKGKSSPVLQDFNKPFLKKVFFMLRHFIAFLIIGIRRKKQENLSGKIGYYAISENTLNSLIFLSQENNTLLLYTSLKLKTPEIPKKHLASKWKYIGVYIKVLFFFFKTNKSFALNYFDLIFYSIGYYESFIALLQKEKPKLMVFSNDHNYDCRALLLACKKSGVKTAYIQHAAVTKDFPPLSFDLNLLEGQDSLLKYKECGPISGETELIGMPKFDNYLKHIKSKNRTILKLGIAFNLADDIEKIEKILTYLAENTECQISYRPHPREKRDLSRLKKIKGTTISDLNEKSFDFLKEQDLIIAGDSSILLEACMLNIIPVHYRFNELTDDYYGFVKNGLAERMNSIKKIHRIIAHYNKEISVRDRTVYYNATINTSYEGKSMELATRLILNFASGSYQNKPT